MSDPARLDCAAEGARRPVAVELTNACNFSCAICPQKRKHEDPGDAAAPYYRPTGFMSPEVFARAVEECRRSARSVTLSFFGEQVLHPRYLEYLDGLRERPFRLEQGTNISLLTREIMDAWVDVRLDLVRMSLDAASAGLFDRTRPGPVRDLDDRPVPAAERFAAVEEKVRHWLARPDHRPTRLVFVKSSRNAAEREDFIARWRPLLGPEDHLLLKRVITYGGKVRDAEVRRHRCNVWEVGYAVIDWRGDVSPCNLDTNIDLRLGSILESGLEELFRGERAAWLREHTGCGRDLSPCHWCVDGNNWADNEVIAAAPAAVGSEA